jgi:hypothetical protein
LENTKGVLMMTKPILALALVSSLAGRVALAAEGTPNPPKPAEAKPADAKPAEAKPAEGAAKKIDWEKMSFAQRKKYMKTTVLPEMKKVFVAFDAKKYAKMNCNTCHGEKGADVKFKMPNPELPKLPQPTDRAGFMAMQQKKPEMVKFMGTQVKPKVAELLGLPEWTMTNPKGFGCYECHTKQEGPSGAAAPPAGAPPAGAPAPAPAPGAKPPAGW